MTSPRVAILHYTIPPIIGGVENVIADHTRLLIDAGYRVTLLAGRGGQASDLGSSGIAILPELDSEHPENLRITRELEQGVVPAAFAMLQSRIEELLTQHLAADLMVVHNVLNFHFNLPLTAALYHLLEEGHTPPMVAWCHDISRYVNPSSGEAQRFGFPWDMLRTYNPNLHYVAVSSQRQNMLAETLSTSPGRIRVIPNGVSPELLLGLGPVGRQVLRENDLLNADLILLMPIRITRAKNIEFALRVTAELKHLQIKPRLIVSGPPDPHASNSGEYFRELVALRRALDLEREAVFLYEAMTELGPRFIDLATIAEFYRLADIVFMPSLREGFGLPILEAGLLDKAVFATEIPAVDELGEELVHTIAPDEPADQVARRMVAWMGQNREQRLRRRVRQGYTWQAIFDQHIDPLIHDCLSGVKERV